MPRDFLVVYEEPAGVASDEPDELVLDVDVEGMPSGAYNVAADFGAAVTNEASGLAVFGLIMTLAGAALGIVVAVLFALNYPDTLRADQALARLHMGLGIGALFLLILGNLLVGLGRNLRARGTLHTLRFTPRGR